MAVRENIIFRSPLRLVFMTRKMCWNDSGMTIDMLRREERREERRESSEWVSKEQKAAFPGDTPSRATEWHAPINVLRIAYYASG